MFQILKNKGKLNKLKREYTKLIEESKSLSGGDKVEKQKVLTEAQMLLNHIEVLSKR